MKKFFLVLVSVFSVFVNLGEASESSVNWNDSINFAFDTLVRVPQNILDLEKSVNEIKNITNQPDLYSKIFPVVNDVLRNLIEQNKNVGTFYYVSTIFALTIAGSILFFDLSSVKLQKILVPVTGTLSVRTVDNSIQFLFNQFQHTRNFSRSYTHLVNHVLLLAFLVYVYNEDVNNVLNIVFPMAGGLIIKNIDPILKIFDYSFKEDVIRNLFHNELSDNQKRYYLSCLLTCHFIKKGITKNSDIQLQMKNLFVKNKNLEYLKNTLMT